jgi:hypothetical protein
MSETRQTFNDERTEETIVKGFHYHATKGDQSERYEEINAAAKNLAEVINQNCPPSREKSLAITSLQESKMWANAAIACNE